MEIPNATLNIKPLALSSEDIDQWMEELIKKDLHSANIPLCAKFDLYAFEQSHEISICGMRKEIDNSRDIDEKKLISTIAFFQVKMKHFRKVEQQTMETEWYKYMTSIDEEVQCTGYFPESFPQEYAGTEIFFEFFNLWRFKLSRMEEIVETSVWRFKSEKELSGIQQEQKPLPQKSAQPLDQITNAILYALRQAYPNFYPQQPEKIGIKPPLSIKRNHLIYSLKILIDEEEFRHLSGSPKKIWERLKRNILTEHGKEFNEISMLKGLSQDNPKTAPDNMPEVLEQLREFLR